MFLAHLRRELHLLEDPLFQFMDVHSYYQRHVIPRLFHVECIRVASSRVGISKLDSESGTLSISDLG